MYIKYGSYQFAAGAVEPIISREPVRNAAGFVIGIKVSVELRGYLDGTSQSEITAATIALENAFKVPFQNLIMYQDDGSESATVLKNANSLTGVRVVSGPNFPTGKNSEGLNIRTFEIKLEAEYPVIGGQFLMDFTEQIAFSGGGPKFIHRPNLLGIPQKQLVYPNTVYRAVQSGHSVGYLGYPTTPPPIWPSALMEAPDKTIVTPKRVGFGPTAYREFAVSWNYRFESAFPLVGLPNLWVI